MSHQVFIERCRDSEPETAESLAKAIAERYGVPPDAILGRLKQGRFQVKANLEIAAARTFMSYLEEQGALCTIVDASGEVVARSPEPEKKEEPPDEGFLELSPADNAPELALMTPPPPPDIEGDGSDYESGLSAGFSAVGGDQDLGALGGNESAASSRPLRLETLDGTSEEEKEAEPNASVADSSDAAAFMPPDMLEEQKFELDVDPEHEPEPAHVPDPSSNEQEEDVAASSSSRMRAATAEPVEESAPSTPAVPKTPPHVAALRALSNHERLRFAVGIMLAVLLGFVIMSMVASSREASRYSTIIAELRAQYDAAETSVAWDALDGARATTLENLQVRRRNIVIMSVFVWLIVGGLFAFLWLRVFDWSRWEEATVGGPVSTPAPS